MSSNDLNVASQANSAQKAGKSQYTQRRDNTKKVNGIPSTEKPTEDQKIQGTKIDAPYSVTIKSTFTVTVPVNSNPTKTQGALTRFLNNFGNTVKNAINAVSNLFQGSSSLKDKVDKLENLQAQLSQATTKTQRDGIASQIKQTETQISDGKKLLVEQLRSNPELRGLANKLLKTDSLGNLKGVLSEIQNKHYSTEIQQKFGRLVAYQKIDITQMQEDALANDVNRLNGSDLSARNDAKKDIIKIQQDRIDNNKATSDSIRDLANGDSDTLALLSLVDSRQEKLGAKIADIAKTYGIALPTLSTEQASSAAAITSEIGKPLIAVQNWASDLRTAVDQIMNYGKTAKTPEEAGKLALEKKQAETHFLAKLEAKKAELDRYAEKKQIASDIAKRIQTIRDEALTLSKTNPIEYYNEIEKISGMIGALSIIASAGNNNFNSILSQSAGTADQTRQIVNQVNAEVKSIVDQFKDNTELSGLVNNVLKTATLGDLKGVLSEIQNSNYSPEIKQKLAELVVYQTIKITINQIDSITRDVNVLNANPNDEAAKSDLIKIMQDSIDNSLASAGMADQIKQSVPQFNTDMNAIVDQLGKAGYGDLANKMLKTSSLGDLNSVLAEVQNSGCSKNIKEKFAELAVYQKIQITLKQEESIAKDVAILKLNPNDVTAKNDIIKIMQDRTNNSKIV